MTVTELRELLAMWPGDSRLEMWYDEEYGSNLIVSPDRYTLRPAHRWHPGLAPLTFEMEWVPEGYWVIW